MINFQDTQLDVFYVSSPSLVSTMTFSCSNTGVWVPPMAPKKLWHMGKWKSRGCPVERVEWWRESFEICECWDGSLWIVSGSCAEVQSAQQLRFSRVMFMKHCSSGGHSCHWGGVVFMERCLNVQVKPKWIHVPTNIRFSQFNVTFYLPGFHRMLLFTFWEIQALLVNGPHFTSSERKILKWQII